MNDDLQSALATNFNDLAAWVKSAAGASGDFIAREAPLFVQEYLAWEFWSNVVDAGVFGLIGFLLIGISALAFWAAAKIDDYDATPMLGIGGIVGVSIGLMFLCHAAFSDVPRAIKAKVAPRVLLVEKVSELSGMKK